MTTKTDKHEYLRKAHQAANDFKYGYVTISNSDLGALLAERDDLLENGKQAVRWAPSSAHWSNELKRLFGDDAREGIDALEARLRAAQAERDALLEALTEVLRINETDADNDVKAWANAMLNAHAAIAKATGEKMP